MTDGIAETIESLVARMGLSVLPVRVRAWDGSETGPADAPVVVLRSPMALRRLLWHPGELGMAQAYVTGELDVDGDLADGLRRAWQAADGAATAKFRFPAAALPAARAARQFGALGPPPGPTRPARFACAAAGTAALGIER